MIEIIVAVALGLFGGWALWNRSGYIEGYRDGLRFADQCNRLIELGRRYDAADAGEGKGDT